MATSSDYAAAGLALMPNGRAWSREGSVLASLFGWFAPTLARLDARSNGLLAESPAGGSLLELLPEWESTLGLPDPCAGLQPTVALRQRAVQAKLTARGGQSIPYLVSYAAALGFAITIEEFLPARYGQARYGLPRYGGDWAHTWRVHAPAIVISAAQYGQHRAGEPYAAWQASQLLCELTRIKPAHTLLLLAYTGTPPAAVWGTALWGRDTWAA